jgi:hypothetical protein
MRQKSWTYLFLQLLGAGIPWVSYLWISYLSAQGENKSVPDLEKVVSPPTGSCLCSHADHGPRL